jgi:hypothetical protein
MFDNLQALDADPASPEALCEYAEFLLTTGPFPAVVQKLYGPYICSYMCPYVCPYMCFCVSLYLVAPHHLTLPCPGRGLQGNNVCR